MNQFAREEINKLRRAVGAGVGSDMNNGPDMHHANGPDLNRIDRSIRESIGSLESYDSRRREQDDEEASRLSGIEENQEDAINQSGTPSESALGSIPAQVRDDTATVQMEELTTQISTLNVQLQGLQEDCDRKEDMLVKSQQLIDLMREKEGELTTTITTLQSNIQVKDTMLEDQSGSIRDLKQKLTQVTNNVTASEALISTLESQVIDGRNTIGELEQSLQQQQHVEINLKRLIEVYHTDLNRMREGVETAGLDDDTTLGGTEWNDNDTIITESIEDDSLRESRSLGEGMRDSLS